MPDPKPMPLEVQAKMAEIEALIAKACASTFESLDRTAIVGHVGRVLAERAGGYRLDYHFAWTPGDVCTLVPHDLFTGLILAGVSLADARPFIARDCHMAVFPFGTYGFGGRGLTFTPYAPAESLTIEFKTAEALEA